MSEQPLSVLFVCTGNSARSQIAEALLRHLTHGRVTVASAGSEPKSEIHPAAVAALKKLYALDMAGQHPKPFADVTGQTFDYVITLCDRAAEHCPMFPGSPERIHWGFPDPSAASPVEASRAFDQAVMGIAARLRTWLALPSIARRIAKNVGS
jgi:protein-tyrosine-phosphatase